MSYTKFYKVCEVKTVVWNTLSMLSALRFNWFSSSWTWTCNSSRYVNRRWCHTNFFQEINHVCREYGKRLWLPLNTNFDCQDLFVSTKWQPKPQIFCKAAALLHSKSRSTVDFWQKKKKTKTGENPLCIKVKRLVILWLVFIELWF